MHTQVSWMADRWSTESATVEKATGFHGDCHLAFHAVVFKGVVLPSSPQR